MAKRFTDTEIWDKEWFMNLSCKLKCLVKFVRDKSDLSGVWSPNWPIAKAYIGEDVTIDELLNIDGGKQFKKIAGNKILCIGFIDFQYGKLSEKSPVHRKILNILQSHKIPYQHPINRVQEEEEEKEEETDVALSIEKWNTRPGAESMQLELPEIKSGAVIELFSITKNTKINKIQVVGLWSVFKQQNFTGEKFYGSQNEVYSHFINWVKTQKIEDAKPKEIQQQTSAPLRKL